MSTERCVSPCLDAGPSLRLLDGGRKGSMTDLIEQDLARDVDLHFERMVRKYQDRLYAFARRMTNQREDAEELVQIAFVRADRAFRTYDADPSRTLAVRDSLDPITLP